MVTRSAWESARLSNERQAPLWQIGCSAPLFQPSDGLNINIDSADLADPSSGLR